MQPMARAKALVRPNTVACLLLATMAILAGGAARQESVTVDEVAHVGAGVSYLQKLDYRLNEEHPPLAKILAALPLVLRGQHADYSSISWTFSQGFFHQYLAEWVFGHEVIFSWNDPYSTMLWARIPMLVLTLVFGWVLYAYAKRLGDERGALLTLTAYVTMPAFLVFGPLVLTDLAVTLFSVLTIWALAAMWREPTRAAKIKFGLALAGALLSKFSAGLLFFSCAALIVSLRLSPGSLVPLDTLERRRWRRLRLWSLIQGMGLALAVVYVVYLVISWNQPTDSFDVIRHFPASPLVRRLVMPLWTYVRGLIGFAVAASRPTYVLGHSYAHGVWFYFPIIFLLKSPLPFLALLVITLVVWAAARPLKKGGAPLVRKGTELDWRALWVSFLVFTAACLLSRLDLSIRHLSVPLALLVLMVARLPMMAGLLRASGSSLGRAAELTAVALACAMAVTAIRAYPYYFPFLNSLAMGKPGFALVNDSNLDWNQALPVVERFVSEHHLDRVLLDEYGFSEPGAYVPQAQFWNCQQPAPADAGRWAVVSSGMIADGHNCLWLMRYPHQELAGGSMYAFALPAEIPPAGSPGGPPLSDAWRNFGGVPGKKDIRLVFLNCIRHPDQLGPTFAGITAEFKGGGTQP